MSLALASPLLPAPDCFWLAEPPSGEAANQGDGGGRAFSSSRGKAGQSGHDLLLLLGSQNPRVPGGVLAGRPVPAAGGGGPALSCPGSAVVQLCVSSVSHSWLKIAAKREKITVWRRKLAKEGLQMLLGMGSA